MPVDLILVPYFLGREGAGMGAGPLALQDGAATLLDPRRVCRLALSETPTNEVGACFDLNRQLATTMLDVVETGAFPVVLTGNCHSQQAVMAGLPDDAGLVWLDCHADFHTPDSTPTGFFDGCGLAMITGECWGTLAATVPGFVPVLEDHIALIGVRDADPTERERLDGSSITEIPCRDAASAGSLLEYTHVPGPGRPLSLHVDMDVLDSSVARANAYTAPGGLRPEELIAVVSDLNERFQIAALTISAFDPSYDTTGTTRETALEVLRVVTAAHR